jgi:hypothetical protein
LREIDVKTPAAWCSRLGLPDGATYAAGAKILRDALAGQTRWCRGPMIFPAR